MRLFKYFHPDRASFLQNWLIRFTQPGAFNDPYEMQPYTNHENLFIDTTELYSNNHDEILNSAIEKLPPELRENISLEQMKQFMKATKPGFRKEIAKVTNKIASNANDDSFQKNFDKHTVVLCLTEKPDNLLMWAHYANNHEGFVVEFDCNHQFFRQGIGKDFAHKSLSKVIYSKSVPTTSLLDLKNLDFAITKSDDWGYEEEWRMLLQNTECTEKITTEPYDIFLFMIPKECIKRVIFGCRASSKLIGNSKQMLADQGIELAKAKLVRSNYGLEFEKI